MVHGGFTHGFDPFYIENKRGDLDFRAFPPYNKGMSIEKQVTLTDSLVGRVRSLQEKQGNQSLMLRVAVNGGGCQGFEYSFGFETAAGPDDRLFEKGGVTVVIDDMSLDHLAGSTIDYVDEMAGAAFKIQNPNAKSTCGCGTSFSL
jgi:iron-sulfur cluster insertion protein